MAVPKYQNFMLPFLQILGDGNEHTLRELYEKLALEFNLSDEDKKELLPSGRQQTYINRIGWAKTYLKKAGLLSSIGRARFIITQRGLSVLNEKPAYIDTKFLQRYEEFLDFTSGGQKPNDNTMEHDNNIDDSNDDRTPEEILESSYQDLRRELAHDLIEKVKACSPSFFERLVIDLLVAMGYGGSRADAGQAIGKSGDEGIDGIINEDKLGLDVVYIQAKRWGNTVGSPIVQAFAGSLEGQRARKGVLITTSKFSQEAKEYVKIIEKKIVLIDGERLAELMIDFDIGVSEYARYIVKKMDTDYFGDE